MRAVAYWPKHDLYFSECEKYEDGCTAMVAEISHKTRPVFWVLATREEAERHIVPHMVNSVIHWQNVLKQPWFVEDETWPKTKEFSFFVPWLPRLTDAPTVMIRAFPYSAMQTRGPWPIGEADPDTCTAKGVEIPDIEHYTFCDVIDHLKLSGNWHSEMRPSPMEEARQGT